MEQVSEVRPVAPAAPGRAIPLGRPRPLWKEILRHWQDYLFISPFFITFVVFSLYPLIWAFQLSFSRWRGTGAMEPVGFENYLVDFGAPCLIPSDTS